MVEQTKTRPLATDNDPLDTDAPIPEIADEAVEKLASRTSTLYQGPDFTADNQQTRAFAQPASEQDESALYAQMDDVITRAGNFPDAGIDVAYLANLSQKQSLTEQDRIRATQEIQRAGGELKHKEAEKLQQQGGQLALDTANALGVGVIAHSFEGMAKAVGLGLVNLGVTTDKKHYALGDQPDGKDEQGRDVAYLDQFHSQQGLPASIMEPGQGRFA